MVDALALEASTSNGMEVQVLSPAQIYANRIRSYFNHF